ncbi:GGDEF domain-containing protein [Streptomyces sp. NPDC001667]
MSSLLPMAATAGPLAVGWAVHGLWFRRQVERARRDPLTGLPGRTAFLAWVRRMRAQGLVLVWVDLDRLKALNDAYGHAAGDAVLVTSAARLAGWAEQHGGYAARLGGDEFAAAITSPSHLPDVLGELHEVLCGSVPFRRHELRVGASVGAYREEDLAESGLGRAMRRADEAMYAAKRSGGGWRIAHGPIPSMTTTNGRRTGRRGTSGGAR